MDYGEPLNTDSTGRIQLRLPIGALWDAKLSTCVDGYSDRDGDTVCPHAAKVEAAFAALGVALVEWLHPDEEVLIEFESCPPGARNLLPPIGCLSAELIIEGE